MIKISTSILALTIENRIEAIKKLNETNTDYIHIDVADGKFVNNKQFKIKEITKISKASNKELDIHLMVNNPMRYIRKIIKLEKVKNITFHLEINKNIKKIISYIKKHNKNCGIAIKPQTNIINLNKYLNDIDLILLMSVEPGFGGQEFIPNTLNKINELKTLTDKKIEVDGGINNKTINLLKNNIDIAVVGSYITNSNDYNETINELKN